MPVTDREDLPGFCAVTGTIEPQIGFEARFPLSRWNGKYYQSGCGGYCGSVRPDKKGYSNTINKALQRGYAAITTDAGHSAGMGDASWAADNPLAVEVYAHRAIPLTFEAGTRMVNAYYGEQAALHYFGGCSNGGRMAAMAAQRYPELFDGILGGAAVLNLSENGGIYGSWVVQANTGPDGLRILDRTNFAHKLPVLEQAVIGQCDAADGQVDGIISLPRHCEVDVSLLPECTPQNDAACFTGPERNVLKKWYRGPRDSSGRQLYPGMPAGSERYWAAWFLDTPTRVAGGNALGGDYARYLGFEGGAPETYTALEFDFDRDPARLVSTGRQLNALDPDLSAFRDAGGKYLMWHGWQDPLVLPDQSVAYYENVLDELGGREAVDPFFRLFMIPGKGHCWEMPSTLPDRFDPIAVLEEWVEQDRAPQRLELRALDPETAVVPAAVICPYPGAPVFLEDLAALPGKYCPAGK
jgi:feruloyl esterase